MISFFMVDRKSDLLLECDFFPCSLLNFFVRKCVEIKQSCYQLSGFSKKKKQMAKEKRKKTVKTKTWMLWFPTLWHCSSHDKICETVRVLLKTVHTS